MTIEHMTPEEEVRLRLAAGISPSTPTEYMLRHIPLWVKMSILRRNLGGGGTTESVTTYDFTTNTYRKNGSTVSLGDVSEFIRLSSATEWKDGKLVEVVNNVPRISGKGLLIEPQIANDMSSGDFRNNYPESLAQVTTGVDSGLGFNYTCFVGGGGEQRADIAFGMEAVSLLPIALESRGVSFLVKAEAPVRYMRFHTANGLPITHRYNTTIDLSDGSVVRQFIFEVINVAHIGGEWLRVDFRVGSGSRYRNLNVTFGMDGEDGMDPSTWTTLPEGVEVGLALPQHVTPPVYSSLTNSYGTPATRAPDILNIQLLPPQTVTGDWDAGVTHSVADGIATFSGHGYIRNITVETL